MVDVVGTLDAQTLAASYRRIAEAKRLRKGTPPVDSPKPHTTTTLGLLIAQQSALTSDDLMEQVQRLNATRASHEWPDLIAVQTVGVLNYALQFPGELIGGDFLPPVEGAFEHSVPAIYIVPVLKPPSEDAFGRLAAFLVAHLALFAPGATLPDRKSLLEGMSGQVITGAGYQYNLRGQLNPVSGPRRFVNQVPRTPLHIQDSRGNAIGTIQFVRWQDGGVVILKGQFPLEALLLFGGHEVVKRGGIVRPGGVQISNVLPLTEQGFVDMVRTFRSKSNVIIREPETAWTIQKTADEGTETPVIGRLQLGILRLRDVVCQGEEARLRFDELYEVVLSAVMSARSTAKESRDKWQGHAADVASGRVARLRGPSIHVDESVDKELRAGIASFVNASVRVVKLGMQQLTKEYGVGLGFVFQQEKAYREGLDVTRREHPLFAAYVERARQWMSPLVQLRNEIEHEGWMLPRVTYSAMGSSVVARQPEIDGVPVVEYMMTTLDRVLCFVEEITAYVLSTRMHPMIAVTEAAMSYRSASSPERFLITLSVGGAKPWVLEYSESSFDDR